MELEGDVLSYLHSSSRRVAGWVTRGMNAGGFARCVAATAKGSGIYGDGGDYVGAGDWGDDGDLFAGAAGDAEVAAGDEAGGAVADWG
jgi:hypothetical protein